MSEENILELNPSSEIKFVKKDIQSIPEGFIELNNTSDGIILYKIKTTDPNKYVVKPNLGVITQGRANRVIISTHKASMQKIKSDRFLVVAAKFSGEENGKKYTIKSIK